MIVSYFKYKKLLDNRNFIFEKLSHEIHELKKDLAEKDKIIEELKKDKSDVQ